MAYCTRSDVVARVTAGRATESNLPQAPSTAEDVADVVIDAAVADAARTLDGRLGVRYRVPFDAPPYVAVPGQVQAWAIAYAAYYATLALNQQQEVSDRNAVALRYAEARREVEATAAGTVDVAGGYPPVSADGDDDGEADVFNRGAQVIDPYVDGIAAYEGGIGGGRIIRVDSPWSRW